MPEANHPPTLLLSYTWSFADFAAGARASSEGKKPIWRVWFGAGVSGILLLLGIFALVDSLHKGETFTWRHQGLAAVVILGALWFIVGRPFWKKRRLRKAFGLSGEGGSSFTWTVTDKTIVIERVSPRPETMDEMKWIDVARVVETSEGWLLHLDARNYYWLPRRAVPPGQVEEFMHIARRGALRYGARSATFLG